MPCPLSTGLWCLMRGFFFTMSTIYRAVEPDEGGLYMPCPLYTGPWGLMRGFVYAMSTIYRAVGPDGGQGGGGVAYAMSTIYRAVGPHEGVCICHVHYIQGCGA